MTIFTSALICAFNKLYLAKFVNKIIALIFYFFNIIKRYAKFSTKTKAQVNFAERQSIALFFIAGIINLALQTVELNIYSTGRNYKLTFFIYRRAIISRVLRGNN